MDVTTYSVKLKVAACKKLDNLAAPVRNRIVAWIERNLVDCKHPRVWGHSLGVEIRNLWRYRVGGCRLVANIRTNEVIILVINADNLNDLYD